MQIRRLELRNIRSYERARLDLTAGTTLIVGDVGSGKTSLLYAIEMALFGVAEVDAAYLVRHGTVHAEVSVRLGDDEHEYDVGRQFRRLKRRGRDAFEAERITFREDGAATSYSATEVRQRVNQLLGFPDNPNPQAHSDLWRWAIYVPQEQMRAILSARPQDRLETVRKALGVERFRTAAENAEALDADLRASARHRRESADRLAHHDLEFAEATAAADRLRLDRVELERAIDRATEEAAERARGHEAAETALRRLEADRREFEGLSREQRSDADELEVRRRAHADREQAIRERVEQLRDLESAAGRRADGERRLSHANDRLQTVRARLDDHATALQALASARSEAAAAARRQSDAAGRAERAGAERSRLEAELARAEADGPAREPPSPTPASLGELDARLEEARLRDRQRAAEVVRARTELAEMEALLVGGVCPRCHQTVRTSDFEGHREEAQRTLRSAVEAEARQAAEVERVDGERKARERFERAHERWEETERRRRTLREAIRVQVEGQDAAEGEVAAATRAAVQSAGAIAELESADRAVQPLRRELAELEAEVREATREGEAARTAEAQSATVRETLTALRREAGRAEAERASLDRRRKEREERLHALSESLGQETEIRRAAEAGKEARAASERRAAEARASMVRVDTRLDAEERRRAVAERGRAERAALTAEAGELEEKGAWVKGPFRLHLLAMERELLTHAHAEFDRAFARYFASLVDDPGLLARVDASFTPEVLIDGESTPAEALSGGERTALALSFRLALASVVRTLGEVRLETLLLDEPTDGFSAEQVVRMGELLAELELPQVVLVSHETQMAGIADRTVRVRKIDGRAVLDGEGSVEDSPPPVAETPRPARRRRSRAPPLPEPASEAASRK